ncbi:MAG: aminoacyl-tRNA hydrolase [Candidatus Roizmanbacteria bacterium]
MIIVGLGNPGPKYAHNRHNVGYMYLDWLQGRADGKSWKENQRGRYHQASIDEDVLIKPLTYMNESGSAVGSILATSSLSPTSLIVVHDDLDLPTGEYKISFGKGPQLHGGINSIEHHLKTKDFWRIRIGVDDRPPENRISGIDYVLEDFLPAQMQTITALFPVIKAACDKNMPRE